MKKPIISLKRRGEKLRLVIGVLLFLLATSLFFMPEEAVNVFASGGKSGVHGLFNIVNGWV